MQGHLLAAPVEGDPPPPPPSESPISASVEAEFRGYFLKLIETDAGQAWLNDEQRKLNVALVERVGRLETRPQAPPPPAPPPSNGERWGSREWGAFIFSLAVMVLNHTYGPGDPMLDLGAGGIGATLIGARTAAKMRAGVR